MAPTTPRPKRPEECSPKEWLTLAWDTLGKGAWGPPTACQVALADAIADPNNRRFVWCGFRGMAKSTVTAAMVPWFWVRNPDYKILVLSEGANKAADFASQVWKLLHGMPELLYLRPQARDRQRMTGFDLGVGSMEQTKSLTSLGIFGNFVGLRADLIIADDIEVPRTCETEGQRSKMWTRVGDFQNLLRPEGPQKVLPLGTPHSENSIYWRLVREKGYDMFVWPAVYPDADLAEFHGINLHPELQGEPDKAGQPSDPQRFPEEKLAVYRAQSNSPREWAMQFLLDPRLSDAARFPLKINDLVVMDLDVRHGPEQVIYSRLRPIDGLEAFNTGFDGDRFHQPLNLDTMKFGEYEDKIMVIDPSGTGPDETAFCGAAWLHGNMFVLDWGGNTMWGPAIDGYTPKTLEELVNRAVAGGFTKIGVEKGFGDGMFAQLLQAAIRKLGLDIAVVIIDGGSGNKEKRIIRAVRPLLSQNRVVLNQKLIEADFRSGEERGLSSFRGLYQLARMCEDVGALEHDDRVDALALACLYYGDRVALDQTEALERQQQRDDAALYEELAWPEGRPDTDNGVAARGLAPRLELTAPKRRKGRGNAPAQMQPRRPIGGFDVTRLIHRNR